MKGLKVIAGFGFLFLFLFASCAYCQDAPLTKDSIVQMVKAGLPEDVIISKIKAQANPPNFSADDLISLKAAGASDGVLRALVSPAPKPDPPAASAAPAAKPVSEIGVYYKLGDDWKPLDPEPVHWKSGGVGKGLLTDGIVKPDLNANLNGQHSGNRLRTPVEILIYVPEGVGITEYELVRLHEHKKSREFRMVTGGVFHKSGGPTRDLLPFDNKKIADRTYVVKLGMIDGGEYGFLPPGAVVSQSIASVGRMYTFSVLE